MKKTKINLIVSREDYQKYQTYFSWIKATAIVFLCLFLILYAIYFFTFLKKKRQIDALTVRKKDLLNSLIQKNSDEAKINYIQKKYQDMKLFLRDDANSSPYYSLLNSALEESTESASLKSFIINKNREVTFTIVFNDFEKLMSFLKFVESESFLNNFEIISLKSFDVVGQSVVKDENYELSFSGKFTPLTYEKKD